jgi:IS5 family transposase
MLKAIVLQFLYDLSNRKLEEQLTGFMPFRWFLNLDPLELPPDYSAYCRSREHLGEGKIAQIFNQTVITVRTKKLVSNQLSIVDATHVRAKVDTYKINRKADDDKSDSPRSSVDPDAAYGYKRKNKPVFGYKAAVAMDTDSGLITKVTATTTGKEHDSEHFSEVCDTRTRGTTAHTGYDSPENFAHFRLSKIKFHPVGENITV